MTRRRGNDTEVEVEKEFEFEAELDIDVDQNLDFDTDVETKVDVKVDIDGNVANFFSDVQAFGDDTSVDSTAVVLVIDNELSSVTLTGTAAAD